MYKGFSSDPHSAYIGEKKKINKSAIEEGKLSFSTCGS